MEVEELSKLTSPYHVLHMIESLRCKLRTLGVPIEESTRSFCDNASILNASTEPEVRLTRRRNSISSYKVRESVAAGALGIAHIDEKDGRNKNSHA